MTLVIQTLQQADADAAGALLRAAFTPYVRRLGREMASTSFEEFTAMVAGGCVYGAFDGDALVGVATTVREDRRWTLDQLGVDPALQRGGVGLALLRHVEAQARNEGADVLALVTAEMFTHLVAFYSANGFVILRRGPPTHGKDAHARVFMEKRLRPVAEGGP